MKLVSIAEVYVSGADNETSRPVSEKSKEQERRGEVRAKEDSGRRIYSAYLRRLFNGSSRTGVFTLATRVIGDLLFPVCPRTTKVPVDRRSGGEIAELRA